MQNFPPLIQCPSGLKSFFWSYRLCRMSLALLRVSWPLSMLLLVRTAVWVWFLWFWCYFQALSRNYSSIICQSLSFRSVLSWQQVSCFNSVSFIHVCCHCACWSFNLPFPNVSSCFSKFLTLIPYWNVCSHPKDSWWTIRKGLERRSGSGPKHHSQFNRCCQGV